MKIAKNFESLTFLFFYCLVCFFPIQSIGAQENELSFNKYIDQLSDIEKVNLPDDGFLISTGGTQSSTALYVVNLDDCVVKLFQGTGKGEPVSSNALPVGTINLKPNERNKLREMVEQILNSRQSFSRFPPQNSSFNLTMTISTPTGLKYINSYGRPVGKVEEAFDYLLQLVQANQNAHRQP